MSATINYADIFNYGETTLYACQYDQRFSYFAYIPKAYDRAAPQDMPLVVAIHGTERGAQTYRDAMVAFAERTQSIILAPLFPCGIIDPTDMDNYKFIKFHNIRFDRVLLAIVDEAAKKYGIRNRNFYIHGFSGGGQFCHRFFYLHPDRLLGLSIASPGRITYPYPAIAWPEGLAGFQQQFGAEIDHQALKKVPVQMLVGELDTEDLGETPYGKTRVERLQALQATYLQAGISVRFEIVPGAAHEGMKLLPAAEAFFERLINENRTPSKAK